MGLSKKIANKNKQRTPQKKGPARPRPFVDIHETMRTVRGQLFIEMLGFLHDKRGYGKKRLEDFCNDFREFYDAIKLYRVTPEEIKGVLKEETGFDVRKTRIADDY